MLTLAGLLLAAMAPAAQPASSSAVARQAIDLAQAGKCRQAVALLRRAEALVKDVDLKRRAGMAGVKCAMSANLQDDALFFIQALSHDFPKDPAILYLKTHVFSDLSIRASQELLYAAPASPQVHQLNAEALETQGKWKEAAYEYKAVLEKDPNMPGIHYRIGRLILSQPRTDTTFADAEKEFKAELAIDPNNAGAEYVLGELARQSENWPEAIAHFSRAVKLDPHFADSFTGLGRSLMESGKANEAIAPLETAIRLEPDNPSAHFYLATAYRHAGRKADAERELAIHKEKSEKAAAAREHLHSSIVGADPIQKEP